MHEPLQASNSQAKVENLYPEWTRETDDVGRDDLRERYRALVRATSDGIVVLDNRARLQEISPAVARLFQVNSPSPHRLSFWFRFIHPSDRKQLGTLLRQERQTTALQTEIRVGGRFAAEPSFRWRVRVVPVQNVVGDPYEWVAAITDITQQSADAEAVRKSEPQLRLLEKTADGIWRADADGKIIALSNEGQEHMGVSLEAVRGDRWINFVHEEERATVWNLWRGCVVTGTPYFSQYRVHIRKADGTTRIVHCQTRAVPIRATDGTVQEWIGTIADVTREVENETERRRSEEELRSLIEATSDEVWHADADGGLTRATPGLLRFLGMEPPSVESAQSGDGSAAAFAERLRALSLRELVHPEDRVEWVQAREDAVAQGKPYKSLARVHRAADPDGTYRWLRSHGVPLKNADGSLRAWVGTVTDVTEEKMAEQQARESGERSRRLLDAFTDGMFRTDANGNTIEVSAGLARLVGMPSPICVNEFRAVWRQAMHPDDVQREVVNWQKSMREARMHDSRYRMTIDGQPKIMRLQAAAVTTPEGSVREWVGVISDVTAAEQAAEAVRVSEERFRSLVQATAGGVWQTDAEGNFTAVSGEFLTLLGVSETEIAAEQERLQAPRSVALQAVVVHRNLSWYIHADDLPQWEQAVSAGAAFGKPCELMLRLRSVGAQDTYRWARWFAVPLREASGAVREWIGTFSDVTETVTAQQKLERSEAQLREAQRLTKSGSWTYSIERAAFHWSDQMFSLWEQEREKGPLSLPEMLSRFVGQDAERLERLLRWTMQHGTMFAQDFAARTVRDNPRWFQLIVQAQKETSGEIVGLFGTVLDITERKELEEESRRAQQFARRVALAVPDTLYVYDTQKKQTVYANRDIGAMLEVTPEAVHGQIPRADSPELNFGAAPTLALLGKATVRKTEKHLSKDVVPLADHTHQESQESPVHPEDAPRLISLQDQLQKARDGQVIETSFRWRNGSGDWRWLHTREMVFARDPLGKPREVMGLAQDITERKVAQDNLRESEEKYRSLVGLLSDWVWETDRASRYTYVSPQVTTCLGYLPKEMTGLPPFDFMHEGDRERTRLISEGIARSRASFTSLTMRFVALSGEIVHLEVSGVPMYDAQGEWIGYRGVSRDVTRRREAEEALRVREERLSRLIESSPDAIATLDLDGRLATINDSGLHLLGLPSTQYAEGQDWFTLVGARETSRQQSKLSLIEPTSQPGTLRDILPTDALETVRQNRTVRFLCCKQATDIPLQWWDVIFAPLRGADGQPEQILSIARDITSQKALEAQKDELLAEAVARAERDALTGVYDHRAFHQRLVEEGNRAHREGRSLAVAMVDVDNFKFFNDAFGHLEGDAVLRHVAGALKESVRPYDTIGRLGGDEFAILMPGVGRMEAYHLLSERVQSNPLAGQWKPAEYDAPIPLRMSFGVAVFPEESPSPLQTLHLADERLYRSKRDGHDGILESLRQELGESLAGFPMLDSLVTAVDGKDRYTRRHSEDVLVYAVMIAHNLQMAPEELMTLRVAALLHDVGKIGVSSRILRLPTRLTDEEYEAIKQHAALGAGLIESLLRNNKTREDNPVNLTELVDAVRHHHESWDGRGYPDGLAGEDIPYMARVLAVADSYSALTTDRPYRKGLSQEGALQVLREGAGRQWDARCVAAFLQAQSPAG